jgi:hypothetical protein
MHLSKISTPPFSALTTTPTVVNYIDSAANKFTYEFIIEG